MIKYAFQGLSILGHISVFYKQVKLTERAKYSRKRIFSKLGPVYNKKNNYSEVEKFILSLYEEGKEYRLFHLRNKILKLLKEDISDFAKDYVYPDVKKLGFCNAKFILTKKGRFQKELCAELIDYTEKNITGLLKSPVALQDLVNDLGPNIIFLEKSVFNKIKKVITKIGDYDTALAIEDNAFTDTFTYSVFDGSSYMGGFAGGGGFGGGGGGFSGFGGGSFGGAGSGGGW